MHEKSSEENESSVESDPYCPGNIPLFDAIYGKHLISLGGTAAIDNMFSNLNIQGLTALDLGFGLGGVAFYLAEKYQMKVSGIEVYSWMVDYANTHAPKNLKHLLEFHSYHDSDEMPYQPQTFDLVYSKGVLNHVADKNPLFRQVHTVLKPGGLFVIADWIYPEATEDNSAPLVCETQESYERALMTAGFGHIECRDDSQLFLQYAKTLLEKLIQARAFIVQTYKQDLFNMILKQHEELIEKINQHQKMAVRIVAKK